EPDTRFNIVAFASDLMPWKKSPVAANVINRASATSWVERLKAKGGSEAQSLAAAGLSGSANLAAGKTNTYKALMYAFDFDPDKPGKGADPKHRQILKNPVDTVFFLSDGRPSTGKIVDQAEILEEVRRRNQRYQLVINCVAIGEFQKAFLKSLAEVTGGVFVDLGQ
ncbi:MAG: vWA domain-containing protein, partial [Planctomycetota bacterium]